MTEIKKELTLVGKILNWISPGFFERFGELYSLHEQAYSLQTRLEWYAEEDTLNDAKRFIQLYKELAWIRKEYNSTKMWFMWKI